jgi:hypothetical protein
MCDSFEDHQDVNQFRGTASKSLAALALKRNSAAGHNHRADPKEASFLPKARKKLPHEKAAHHANRPIGILHIRMAAPSLGRSGIAISK